jgi:phage tail protein X
MNFITVNTDTTLADLTSQVYSLNAATAAAVSQAQAALRAANPNLAGLAKFPAGTLIIVPDVPGVNATTALPSLTGVSADVVTQLQLSQTGAQTVLEQSASSQTQASQSSATLARNRAVAGLADLIPDLQTRLAQIVNQADIDIKQVAADRTTQLQGLAQLKTDLGSLAS